MFTGLVEVLGRFAERNDDRFTFIWPNHSEAFALGESISVNGCCLTVVASEGNCWQADVIAETLSRTALAQLQPGDSVNMERPLRFSDRLGGHVVQGHVDAVGIVTQGPPELRVEFDASLAKFAVTKGSIAIDGVSLTVVDAGDDWLSVSLIPHTLLVTTLGSRGVGTKVNLEFDIVAKYLERMQGFGGRGQ